MHSAKKNFEKAYNVYKEMTLVGWLSNFTLHLSYVYHGEGDFKAALGYAKESIDLAKKNQDREVEGPARIWLGRIIGKVESSRSSEAEKYIVQGIKLLNKLKLRPTIAQGYFFLGELYANTGRKEEALTNLKKALTMCQEMGIGYWPDKIQAVLDRL